VLLCGSLAAIALPFRRPELIYKPGTTDVDRIAGIPTAAIWGGASTVLALFTVGVDGVPAIHIEEALWVCVEALNSG